MGGMHGFGPVRTPDGGLTYHEPWELRPLVIACLIGSGWRTAIEGLDPADYLASSYYVRWLRAAEHRLVEQGYVTPEDLSRWRATLSETPDADRPAKERFLRRRPRLTLLHDAVVQLFIHARNTCEHGWLDGHDVAANGVKRLGEHDRHAA